MNPTIIANWKLNPASKKEAESLYGSVCKKIKGVKNIEIVFCPPFVYSSVIIPKQNIFLGSQNCFWEDEGAYTGEVSAKQLADLKCSHIIIGHSERRKYFNETNEIVNKKIKACLNSNLIPILCIGETQEQRDRGETQKIIETELSEGLTEIPEAKLRGKGFIIAYEPIWAVGTGRPCDVEESQKMNLLIKKIVSETYDLPILKSLKVVYGGSVNSKNASGYVKEAGYDGLLVGGASLKPDEFSAIVKNCI
jgi:triosephosphate isomerase (TIM)